MDYIYRLKSNESGNSLSTGAVVAIVIVSLIVFALAIVFLITTINAKRNKEAN